jgi:hypothetical protein
MTALAVVLGAGIGWAQTGAGTGAAPDTALNDLLTKLESTAQRSDGDLSRLHCDKWKADSTSRQQAQENASALRRNLENAVPELVKQMRTEPASMTANFKLYRDLDALYEAMSSLAESAGAFAAADQYSPLAEDSEQLDRIRHQLAERVELLSTSDDTELHRLRAQMAAAPSAAPSKTAAAPARIVVDDNSKAAAAKKKPKSPAKTASKPSAANGASQP